MYGSVRRQNIAPANMVPLEAVQEIVQQMTNPVKKKAPLEADGGAYRAYCYNVYTKKK